MASAGPCEKRLQAGNPTPPRPSRGSDLRETPWERRARLFLSLGRGHGNAPAGSLAGEAPGAPSLPGTGSSATGPGRVLAAGLAGMDAVTGGVWGGAFLPAAWDAVQALAIAHAQASLHPAWPCLLPPFVPAASRAIDASCQVWSAYQAQLRPPGRAGSTWGPCPGWGVLSAPREDRPTTGVGCPRFWGSSQTSPGAVGWGPLALSTQYKAAAPVPSMRHGRAAQVQARYVVKLSSFQGSQSLSMLTPLAASEVADGNV